MNVTLLGTGTPAPNPDRAPAAVLVEIDQHCMLFDVGSGTIRQIARAGMDIASIESVFLTHHHFDHIGDLFDIIVLTALCGRTDPLRIYGPGGTNEIVRALIDVVYDRDIRTRIAEVEGLRKRGFDTDASPENIRAVEIHELEHGAVVTLNDTQVKTYDVLHGDFPTDPALDWHCLGYRIESEGNVVSISGDTVPCDGVLRLAAQSDLHIQCCHFSMDRLDDAIVAEMTRATLPSSRQAGQIAADAHVKHLVLTHISMNVATDDHIDKLIQEVAEVYDGHVTVGCDLQSFIVG